MAQRTAGQFERCQIPQTGIGDERKENQTDKSPTCRFATWKVDHGKPTAKTPRTPRKRIEDGGSKIASFCKQSSIFHPRFSIFFFLGVLGVLAVGFPWLTF